MSAQNIGNPVSQGESVARTKIKKRLLKIIIAITVIFALLILFGIPAFVSSGAGQSFILSKVNKSIDGTLQFKNLEMGWFKGVAIRELTFTDAAETIVADVATITTKPHYLSLLTGSPSFGKTVIDKPKVTIRIAEYEAGKKQASPAGQDEQVRSAGVPFGQIDLTINEGAFELIGRKSESVTISNINSQLKVQPPGKPTEFSTSMSIAAEGKKSPVEARATLKPKESATSILEGVSGELCVDTTELDLSSLQPFFNLLGIDLTASGLVSANIHAELKDGAVHQLDATINGSNNVTVTADYLKGDTLKTSTLALDVKLVTEKELVKIQKFRAETDWLSANADGTFPTTFDSLNNFLKAGAAFNAQLSCDMAELISQLPNTAGLKPDTQITSGNLKADIKTDQTDAGNQLTAYALLSDFKGKIAEKSIGLSRPLEAKAVLSADDAGIKYDQVKLSSSFADVSATGTSDLLNYDGLANLKKFQTEFGRLFDMTYEVEGNFSAKGTLTQQKGKISTTGTAPVTNFTLTSPGEQTASEPNAQIAYDLEFLTKEKFVSINKLNAEAELGTIITRDAVVPLTKKSEKSLNVPLETKIHLRKLQPFIELFRPDLLKANKLEGTALSTLSVSRKDREYSFITEDTKIKKFRFTSPDGNSFYRDEVTVAAEVRLTPTLMEVEWSQSTSGSPLATKGHFTRKIGPKQVEIEADADYEIDLREVTTLMSSRLPKGLKLEGQRKGTIKLSTHYPPQEPNRFTQNLDADTTFGFDSAEYMGLKVGTTEIKLKAKNGLLTIPPFSTTANEGTLNFASKVDLTESPMMLSIPEPIQIAENVQINDQVSKNLLMYLNPIFANQTGVTGIANLHAEELKIPLGKAPPEALKIEGTVGLPSFKVKSMGLLAAVLAKTSISGQVDGGVSPTKFTLNKGTISYNNMALRINQYPLNFAGTINMPNNKLDMKITTPYVLTSDFDFRTVEIGQSQINPEERLKISLTGFISKPEFDWPHITKDLLEQQLKKRLQKEIFDQLEDVFK